MQSSHKVRALMKPWASSKATDLFQIQPFRVLSNLNKALLLERRFLHNEECWWFGENSPSSVWIEPCFDRFFRNTSTRNRLPYSWFVGRANLCFWLLPVQWPHGKEHMPSSLRRHIQNSHSRWIGSTLQIV